MKARHYTTAGSVRGECGHKHRTLVGAAECLQRDHAGCATQGGYSDRAVVAVLGDGKLEPLGDSEQDEVSAIVNGEVRP